MLGRMMEIFIRRRVLSVVVSFLILLVGLRAMLLLPVRQFPLLTNTTISIRTTYPGAPPELMQGFITTPIERAVSAVEGVDYITSSSQQGTSAISVVIRLNYDPGRALTDVLTKVQQVKSQLPREANDPIISRSAGADPVLFIMFSGTDSTGPEITEYLTRIVQPMIATVEGVASTDFIGGGNLAMRLWLDPARMAARDVTADDVANAIRNNNVQAAPGQTKSAFVTANIETNTGVRDEQAFRQLVIKATGGTLVTVGDVADVELAAENSNMMALADGRNCVILAVSPLPDANPLTLSRGVRALLPEIERTLPPGVGLHIGVDQSRFIEKSINEVVKTLSEAIVIVIVVIFLFLGTVRSVLIPVVTIPLSIVGVGVFMLAFGFSINLLTLLAMVLATGLVVDDAIVVVENIHRHIEEGASPFDAAIRGIREIVGPVISMALTLAAVYMPIGFLGGLTGALFKEFAFTLAGAMAISGVIALTLSPMMCANLLQPANSEGRFAAAVSAYLGRLTDSYGRALTVTLQYRGAVVVAGAAILVSVAFMFLNAKKELAPAEDQGDFRIQMRGPQYVNLDYMAAYFRQVNELLAKVPEIDKRFVIAGRDGPPSSGFGGARAVDWSARKRNLLDILPELQRTLNGVDGFTAFVFSPSPLPGIAGGPPVQMVVSSTGPYEQIYDTVEDLKTAARDSGLFTAMDSTLNFNSPAVEVTVDRAKANALGVSMDAIGRTLATLVGENYVNRFIVEGRAYQVIPQVPRAMRLSGESLRSFYVRTAAGKQIPLATVVTVSEAVRPNALTRFNQLNSSTFQASLMPGVSMGEAIAFLQARAKLLPAGFATAYLADARQFVQEGSQLLVTFGFALLVIYLVLAAQFESLRDPLVILVSVPMSVCGALLPLFFGLATLNIYTEVGLVTLIGLISKHGILMVAFARDKQLREGCDRRTAITEAARVRLRPILMTTLAMVAGLMPLVFASGAGASSRFALGVVVVSGMAVGTLFTLFALPTAYTWIATERRGRAAALERETLAPAE
jgi:multidrug efflux pump